MIDDKNRGPVLRVELLDWYYYIPFLSTIRFIGISTRYQSSNSLFTLARMVARPAEIKYRIEQKPSKNGGTFGKKSWTVSTCPQTESITSFPVGIHLSTSPIFRSAKSGFQPSGYLIISLSLLKEKVLYKDGLWKVWVHGKAQLCPMTTGSLSWIKELDELQVPSLLFPGIWARRSYDRCGTYPPQFRATIDFRIS